MNRRQPALLLAGLLGLLSACGENAAVDRTGRLPGLQPQATGPKSAKRGIAYDLSTAADLAALAPGVSWWYNWGSSPNAGAPQDAGSTYGMDFVPMLWNGNFDVAAVEAKIRGNPAARYLLVLNEPNLTDQANLTPTQAADLWPRYEQVAADTGVKLVGPAMNWGTMPGYSDPVVWLDAFYSAYRARNGNRDPRIDYLAFHWYDYGLASQLDRLKKYGKPFWVTEFSNWHSGSDGAQIDTLAKQKAQMADMVATLESRSDVFRYAWFTGRWNSDAHFISLLGANGQLTELGKYYLSLPYSSATGCGTVNVAQNKAATASSVENAATSATAATDGNASTRWSSTFSDPQWVQVDLGSAQSICQVTLQWEAASAKAFQIQVSNDARTWTTAYSTASGTGGTQTVNLDQTGRYVRMYGTQRNTGYGYSLYELQVRTRP
ncbi:glycosyl hydrolase [Deinococcus hopiensis]|uniref:F5/8 type C domain-containing protein n=1 Tax=Deinococcus hopiensis KR-140 TaxID=695939 RepID=A0A1W1UGF4_9DEIO|nr:glycosyl hydrolase [Deinococcus hopiensis]SMB79891.1 F5/8 type C domain-containing protein [Deinococcus hopiensis KR-140]